MLAWALQHIFPRVNKAELAGTQGTGACAQLQLADRLLLQQAPALAAAPWHTRSLTVGQPSDSWSAAAAATCMAAAPPQ